MSDLRARLEKVKQTLHVIEMNGGSGYYESGYQTGYIKACEEALEELAAERSAREAAEHRIGELQATVDRDAVQEELDNQRIADLESRLSAAEDALDLLQHSINMMGPFQDALSWVSELQIMHDKVRAALSPSEKETK